MSRQNFIQSLLPGAMEASRRTGVDPRIIIAQAAQETGWGRSAPGNNYFGIKSHGKSGGQTFTTHEVINGQRVKMKDSFRQFDSPSDSALGYADFLNTNPRYKPMREAKGLDAQIDALGRSGYATDPNYASSIRNIAYGLDLPNMPAGSSGLSPEQADFIRSNPQPGGFGADLERQAEQQPGQTGMFAPPPPDPGVPMGVADYATSEDKGSLGKGLQGFFKALAQTPDAPVPRHGPMPDASKSGMALLDFLEQPTMGDILLKKRLGPLLRG